LDKYEYKVRLEEINNLIIDRDFEEAAIIADSIDWNRVKSVKTLCMISDIYKYVGRLEDAQQLLLAAYERHPSGKSIVFSLCEVCIKMGQYVEAIEYYKEYVQLAPQDYGGFVLLYKIYVASEASLEQRIIVLEQLQNRERVEKWMYELAYLYHRVGNATKCIEECDELILWFGEGKYVTKAMELKMQHAPLTATQQAKYDTKDITASLAPIDDEALEKAEAQTEESSYQETPTVLEEQIPQGTDDDIQVKTDVSQYNTINLQKELADSLKDMWEVTSDNVIRPISTSLNPEDEKTVEDAQKDAFTSVTEEATEETAEATSKEDSKETPEETSEEKVPEQVSDDTKVIVKDILEEDPDGQMSIVDDDLTATKVLQEIRASHKDEEIPSAIITETTYEVGRGDGNFERYLGMEYDGQISMIVPEETNAIEKQITGQLHIQDILAEWERKKKEEQSKREEEVRKIVLSHTGNILIDFDKAVRDGLLEKLEKEPVSTSGPIEYLPAEDEVYQDSVDDTDEETEEITFEEDLSEDVPLPEDETAEELAEVQEELTEEETTEEELTEEETPEEETTEEELTEETSEEEETAPEVKEETVEDTEPQKESAEVVMAEAASREEEESPAGRELTNEEKELYAAYIQNKKIQAQLVNAVDSVSLAAYTGNLIITGDEGMDPITLAKNMMKEIQTIDNNFSGKIAKISGNSLNVREPAEVISKIANGALIIENAGRMSAETSEKIYKALQNENSGIIIVITGGKKSLSKLLDAYPKLKDCFSAQIDLEALDNDTLVRFAKEYAFGQEYSIDQMGLLALHRKIADNQTSDHAVTLVEVKTMVADAIRNANRRNVGHFFDVLFGKRYDDEDMIILKEKDFDKK